MFNINKEGVIFENINLRNDDEHLTDEEKAEIAEQDRIAAEKAHAMEVPAKSDKRKSKAA